MQKKIAEAENYLIHSYNRYPVMLDHGEGVYLYDTEGKKYLDFGGGIAVCALGYSDETYKNALKEQIDRGIHFSNYFYSEPLVKAAKGLADASGMDKVFMANSGGEANEGALKLARKYAIMKGHEERHEIVSMDKAFHGRSMGALSVTGTKKYREPFEPMIGGVSFARYNDLDSVKEKITDNTYAVIVEAVQGEGGIYPADREFLQGIRTLCDEHDIMMICDEIQCGMGRTGRMFAYQHYGIQPDIVTMAKGIGNGMTVGAFATTAEIAEALVPGDHGTTFGGNPLAAAAVSVTLDIFAKNNIVQHVAETGAYLGERLEEIVKAKKIARETRGLGLMRGLELTEAAGPYVMKALEKGLILMSAGTNVIRFVPPLVIEKKHVDEMTAVLDKIL
ncbi:MAG: aspartate aminotransferase family protein [Eubacterium sp.]|nr:aspartate aminotransferase family protein [Eubacterium sp.]